MAQTPVFTTLPTISPTSGAVGTTFRGSDGVATRTSSYRRRWLLSGTPVGTGTTVTPTTAGSLVLEVTAIGNGANAGSTKARSKAVTVAPAATATPAPVFTTKPTISPTSGVVGATFRASDGIATNASSYSRRWLLSGALIGTGTSVVPTTAGSLVLEVTATGAGGSMKATSAAVSVASATTSTLSPTPAPASSSGPITFASGTEAKAFWRSFGKTGPEIFAALPNIQAAMGTGLSNPAALIKKTATVNVAGTNALIENLDVTAGGISVMGASGDVIIRNCRIALPTQPDGLGPVSFIWGLPSAANLKTVTIENCELVGDPTNGRITKAIEAAGHVTYTIRYSHLRDMPADAFSANGTAVIEYNTIFRFGMKQYAHGDGVQVRGGQNHRVRFNVFLSVSKDAPRQWGPGEGDLANVVRLAAPANRQATMPGSIRGLTAEGNLFLHGGYNLTQIVASPGEVVTDILFADNLAGFPEIRPGNFANTQVYKGLSKTATTGVQRVEFRGNETIEGGPWLHEGSNVEGNWFQ